MVQQTETLEEETGQGRSESPVQVGEDDGATWKAGKQELIILSTMAALNVILALDATVLVPALPMLSRELDGTATETFWAGTSYLLANAVFIPFLGSVSDILGRQSVLLFSVLMFTAGTIVCCTASGFTQLLVGRTIQGVGGGGLFTLSFIITTDIIPLRKRPKYQSLIMASFAIGTIFGPLTGGLVAEHSDWQWLFYINFPFCAIGLMVIPFAFRRLELKAKLSLSQSFRRIDWIGGITFMAGITGFLMGITWGGVQYPWSAFQTWLPILLGGLSIAISLLYQGLIAPFPLIRLRIFNNFSGVLVFILILFFGFQLYAHLYYLPFYLSSVKAMKPSITGVFIMALSVIMVPLGVMTGIAITRRGTYLWAIWLGFAFLVLENGLLLYLDQNKNLAEHFFIIMVVAVGDGFLMVSLSIATQATTATRDAVSAVGMFTFLRQLGICIGVGVGGTVFNNFLLRSLEKRGFSDEVAHRIAENSEAFVASLIEMPDTSTEKAEITAAYVEGFRGIWYLLLAVAAVSLALSFLIRHHSIDKGLESSHELQRHGRKSGREDGGRGE
ncbi:major facilitator superfamily domain-containing protein [Rhypophila decipiens]|uniref:Major facilitator superfamily domain-containing protein n=1 Tax=Rhypophila decipiens TaxID=261697 RepID=A0AAN7BA74_9PEZI|nr:major facilitator superfamily domain-containing protein [Rhypophila decipiens]